MKTEDEIQEMADKATEAAQEPKFVGMSYEDGVRTALDWVLGKVEDSPLE